MDAYLIASAPELLEALVAGYEAIEQYGHPEVLDLVNKALSKAREGMK